MIPSKETVDAARDHADYKALTENPAFQHLLEDARNTVMRQWTLLLSVEPEDLKRLQGFIEGANYVLEYAGAKVTEARLLLDRQDEDRRASFESVRAAAASQRERSARRSSVGAATLES